MIQIGQHYFLNGVASTEWLKDPEWRWWVAKQCDLWRIHCELAE